MSMRDASLKRTICEVLREINDMHQGTSDHDNIVRFKLAEAEHMAKRMTAKLRDYNKEYDADWWEKNPDYERDLNNRLGKGYQAV